MPFEATLPAELWLIILDMVISTGITLLEQCDHTSFPDICDYLHYPTDGGRVPFDNSYSQLRLVCQMFNALLGSSSSPQYVMNPHRDSIPASARAVYIRYSYTAQIISGHVRRLLKEPLICHRLIHLDTFSKHPRLPNIPAPFDLLCENSGALPNLRCLALRFDVESNNAEIPFWTLLNDAFPLLRRLVLTRHGVEMHPILRECDGDITFRNLELLILDNGIHCVPRLHFPRLRHVALDIFSGLELEILTRSPLLESAHFGVVNSGTKLDLKAFPRLRLVGVWEGHARAILPVGDDHPLEHLWLTGIHGNFNYSPAAHYIMRVTRILPRVSRITLDVSMYAAASLEARLQEVDLRSVGLSICSTPRSRSRLVVKRVRMDPPTTGQPRPAKQHPLLNWIQSKIHR